MDSFETPYEEEAAYIECTVCDKSIRGDTLYKIHLTTPGHMKKEDALVASGLAVRPNYVPAFEDILQYLDYVKLNEPIIGLNYLDQLSCNDPKEGPRYSCRLCNHQNSNLPEIVHHVIGRKHRQKYMELKRPELLTWNKQFIMTQGGKAIRARAEIIERQDGRGTPMLLAKKGMEVSRVPPRQEQNRGRNTQRDVPSHLPGLIDYQDEYSHPGRHPAGYQNTPPFHPEDPHISNRDRPKYQEEDSLRHGRVEKELRKADYRQSDMHRREYVNPDYCTEYEKEYVDDPPRRAVLEPGGVSRYDSREKMPHGQAQHVEHYREEAPPYGRPPPERDQLKEFYTEEVRRRQVCAEYPEGDEQRWSQERESGRHNGMNIAGRPGSREPEAKRRGGPTPMESGRSHDHLFNTIMDYCQEMGEPTQEEAVAKPGPSRTGPPTSQRRVEAIRALSDIPEPFRRFLTGATNDQEHGKRKRKSRFSDATAEEVETTKEMFSDEYGRPNPKFGSRSRPVRPVIHGAQHPDSNIDTQSPHHTENYRRGGSESRDVFDMLKNIEFENAEDADLLKNKLCNLLKEFKTKKSAKVVQNSQGRAAISKDYNSLNPDRGPSPRQQFDTTLREDSDLRRPEDLYFKEGHRGRGWQQHEHIHDEQLQEYHHPVRGEPRLSNRSRYEEVFGLPGQSRTPRASHPDEPARYPERFQEPMNPHGYSPAAEKFLDSYSSAPLLHVERGPMPGQSRTPHASHPDDPARYLDRFQEHMNPRDFSTAAEKFLDSYSSGPPLHMERGPRMDRGHRYSNSLDKITSTLLELVARK